MADELMLMQFSGAQAMQQLSGINVGNRPLKPPSMGMVLTETGHVLLSTDRPHRIRRLRQQDGEIACRL